MACPGKRNQRLKPAVPWWCRNLGPRGQGRSDLVSHSESSLYPCALFETSLTQPATHTSKAQPSPPSPQQRPTPTTNKLALSQRLASGPAQSPQPQPSNPSKAHPSLFSHQPTQARPSPPRPVLCIALPLPRRFLRAHDINWSYDARTCPCLNRHLTSSAACSRTTDAARSAWPRRATRSVYNSRLRSDARGRADGPVFEPAPSPPLSGVGPPSFALAGSRAVFLYSKHCASACVLRSKLN